MLQEQLLLQHQMLLAASGTYYIKGTTAAGCASALMPVVVTVNSCTDCCYN